MGARLLVWVLLLGLSAGACFAYGQIVDQFDTASLWRVVLPVFLGFAGLLVVLLSPAISSRRGLFCYVWLPAILLRVFLLPAAESDDVNRYLWEGKLVSQGISPYLYRGDAEAWRMHRDVYWEGMNHKDKPTAYPPLAEMTFGVIAGVVYHPLSFKFAFLIADLLTLWAVLTLLRMRGLSLAYAGFYAFNPLVLLSFAAEAHFDAFMLAPLVWAVWLYETGRTRCAVALASIATGIKWVTLPLVPFFAGRRLVTGALIALITLLLPALFFWESLPSLVNGLLQFGGTRSFNGPIYDLLLLGIGLPRIVCTLLVGGLFAGVILWRWFGRESAPLDSHIRWIIGALIVLSPTVHFWYVAWLAPFVALRPSLPWVALSITGGVYFFVWSNETWGLLPWQQCVFWVPFFGACAYEIWSTRGRVLRLKKRAAGGGERIAVVIPTLNAVRDLPTSLASLANQSEAVDEVIIADAGSQDGTVDLREFGNLPLRVIETDVGRGQQIVSGIEAANADWVLVLHADCVLQTSSVANLKSMVSANRAIIGGAFGQRFSESTLELLPIELLNDLRGLFLRTAFGDQVQFFHRETVLRENLFPRQPLMEDVESSWRLRESGEFVFLNQPCLSNRRKWSRQGWLKRFSLVLRLVARYRWARLRGLDQAEKLSRDLYDEYYGRQG